MIFTKARRIELDAHIPFEDLNIGAVFETETTRLMCVKTTEKEYEVISYTKESTSTNVPLKESIWATDIYAYCVYPCTREMMEGR